MIRASAPYTSGWGSFVLLKIDRVRVARGGSLSTLHRWLGVSRCYHTCSFMCTKSHRHDGTHPRFNEAGTSGLGLSKDGEPPVCEKCLYI